MTLEILLIQISLTNNKLELGLFKKDRLVYSKNIGHYFYFSNRECTQKYACCIFLKLCLQYIKIQ